MVKCSKCGSENKSEAKFCHSCGAKLDIKDPYNLDGKSREYGSTTGKSAGSASAYYDHSANSGGSSSDSTGGIDNFRNMSNFKKIIFACCAVFIVLFIFSLAAQALGFDMEPYSENKTAYHNYSSLDLDDDGALCLEELEIEYSNISSSKMSDIFKKSDKNRNHLIRGAEYDMLNYYVNEHFKDLEKKKNEKTSSSSSSSSSSSGSSSYKSPFTTSGSSDDGAETCPFCGSEAVYESGNSYKCAECGRTISNPDDLDLNYDEGYY